MKYKCIMSDLDGTLLQQGEILTQNTVNTLTRLMDAGMLFIPTSGRSFYCMPQSVMTLPGVKYAITSNGVAIQEAKTGKYLYQLLLAPDTAPRIFQLMKDLPVTYEAFVDGRPYCDQKYYSDPCKYGAGKGSLPYIARTRTPVDNIQEFMLKHHASLENMDIIVQPRMQQELISVLRNALPDIYVTSSMPHMIEVSHKNTGKHAGLYEMARLLHITRSSLSEMRITTARCWLPQA